MIDRVVGVLDCLDQPVVIFANLALVNHLANLKLMLNHLSIRLQYFSELPIQIEYRLVVIQFFLGKIQCDFFL